MADSTTITIRVDRSTKERLDAVATALKRSKSFVAGEAIEEYLAVQEWQIDGITQGLTSLRAGKGVAHDDVLSWVRSWDTDNELPQPKV
ncbi:MAG: ribbon-helix-helix protein, CopG family [Hyphomicrobiales bacterium]|nr:ribbon-helix-helix protein, CopG family [Hyphomicrobiales bacterium]